MIARLVLALLLLFPVAATGQQNLSTGGSPTFRGVTLTERLCPPDAIMVTCAPYSLVGDGSDETAAIQALLDANKSATKPIIFPAGKTFGITATIKVRGWDGGRILGYGATLNWIGAADPTCDQAAAQPECSAFIKLEASKRVTVEGFTFTTSGNKPGYGVYISSYQPVITAGNPQIVDTRIDVTADPTLRRGFAASGTAYIAGTDAFTYTSIGTSAGACGGAGPYCFLGVAGIGSNYGATQQVWFLENPKTPSNNNLRDLTVNSGAAVAGFQFGDNGYDFGCNTGNDEPWNVDGNRGYNLATYGALPLWGFRQQGITSAGTMLEDSERLAGSDADHNLGCGNAVTIRGQEFGGNTATNGAFYFTGGVGLTTIDASGDQELNETFIKKNTGTTGDILVLGGRLRPGAVAATGLKYIDFSGEGNLTLVGVTITGRGATQTPEEVYVTTGGSETVFNEVGVVSEGVIYNVHGNVRWTRTGDHSYHQAVGTGDGDKYRWNRLVNLRNGAGGDACFEWRDGNASTTARTGLWRICHKGASADGYAYIQAAVPKYGLTLDGAVTTASTQINVSADPATYGFTNGAAAAVIGGIEKSYWVTFSYTSTDTSCGGPAGCFKGVTGVSGYAPTGTPVVAEWAQQATGGIIQEWHATGTTLNQNLTMATGTNITLPSAGTLCWSTDACLQRLAADTLMMQRGLNGQAVKLYRRYESGTEYARLSIGWDGVDSYEIDGGNGEAAGVYAANFPLKLNAGTGGLKLGLHGAYLFQVGTAGTHWWITSAGDFIGGYPFAFSPYGNSPGGDADITVDGRSSYQTVSCSVATCAMTILETDAINGQVLEISNAGSNPITIPPVASQVVTIGGETLTLAQYATATFRYASDRWVQTASSAGRAHKVWLPAAGCNNATAGTIWDLPTATAPTPTCVGTNRRMGVLQFPDSDGDYTAFNHLMLPADFLAAAPVDAVVVWKTSSSTTSHTAVWQLATSCPGDDDNYDPAFNAATEISGDAKAAADDIIRTAGTNITKTGCIAGDLMNLKILRNRTHASDDLVGTIDLIGVELTYRRTQ